MKQYFLVIGILLVACGESRDVQSSEDSQIPGGAIVQDYASITGLQKAVVMSGDVIVGEGDFLNGRYHGTWTSYNAEGKVQSITTYLHGKKQGVQLLFDDLGYVGAKAVYHDDQLNGEYLIFKRNKIVERRNYTGGVLNGSQEKFYVNGVVMEESNYTDGKIDGVAKWYDQEGNLTIEYEYRMGERVKE